MFIAHHQRDVMFDDKERVSIAVSYSKEKLLDHLKKDYVFLEDLGHDYWRIKLWKECKHDHILVITTITVVE